MKIDTDMPQKGRLILISHGERKIGTAKGTEHSKNVQRTGIFFFELLQDGAFNDSMRGCIQFH